MGRFVEMSQIVSGFVPVDLAAAAQVGDFISLENFQRAVVLLHKAAGAGGEDPIITLEQAQDVAGTGVKALNFTDAWVKEGTLNTIGQFTRVTQASANTFTRAIGASQAIWVIEFDADDLDVNNGFKTLRASLNDPGVTAQLAGLLYFARDPVYAQATPPSAIVD